MVGADLWVSVSGERGEGVGGEGVVVVREGYEGVGEQEK